MRVTAAADAVDISTLALLQSQTDQGKAAMFCASLAGCVNVLGLPDVVHCGLIRLSWSQAGDTFWDGGCEMGMS